MSNPVMLPKTRLAANAGGDEGYDDGQQVAARRNVAGAGAGDAVDGTGASRD